MYKILAKTFFIGKKIHFLTSCHSTNEVASDLFQAQAAVEGIVVITDHQTAGKGQRGNTWESEPGKNLTFSVILHPRFLRVDQQFLLNVAVSLGIADFMWELGLDAQVKWPNDIYLKEKKICGILIKNSVKQGMIEGTVAGIGFNVNQSLFQHPGATSLCHHLDSVPDLGEVLEGLLLHVEKRYMQLRRGEEASLNDDYEHHLYWRGEMRTFKDDRHERFSGIIRGVDGSGRLKIQTAKGISLYAHKEVAFIA